MKNLLLKLSISTHRERGYKPVEVEFCNLHRFINFNGFYSACFFNGGYRLRKNFLGGNTVIILDFDEEVTIEDAKNIFKDQLYLITTTRNHQKAKGTKPPCDRFRLLLPLKESIDLPAHEFKKLMSYIISVFRSDAAPSDPARMFYGNPEGEHIYNFEGELFDWRHWYSQIPPEPKRKKHKKEFKVDKDYDFDKLVSECPQIKNFVDKKREGLPYPEWFHCCGVLAFLPNGNDLVHNYSCYDERYKEAETEKNYQSAVEGLSGATRCSTFYPINPLCHSCIYKGLLNSPITLGGSTTSVLTENLMIAAAELERRANIKLNLLKAYHNRRVSFQNPVRRHVVESEDIIQVYSNVEQASSARFEKIKSILESLYPLVSFPEGESVV